MGSTDHHKSRDELLAELEAVRARLTELESFRQAPVHEHDVFVSLFNSIDEPVYICDPTTYEILFANPACRQAVGVEELVGKKCYEALQGLSSPCEFCTNGIIFDRGRGSPYYWEYQNRLNKRWYHCIDKAIRWPDGRLVRYEMAVDITDRIRAEQALTDSEARFRRIIESSPIGIRIVQDNQYVYANPTFVAMFGYASMDAIKNLPVQDLFAERDHHLACMVPSTSEDQSRIPITYEATGLRADGSQFEVSLWLASIQYQGTPSSLGFVIDTSAEKNLRAQLYQAQKLEAIGTLAGGIAHDFNNLLTCIQGTISLALSHLERSHQEYERLQNVEGFIQSGAALTRRILDFARGSSYEVQTVDINEIIRSSSRMYGYTRKDILIRRELAKDIWPIEVDHGQLEHVLLNLYVNAGQAMPLGGELKLKTENVILDEDVCRSYGISPGRYVQIAVSDTGEGMDSLIRERIFEPFFSTREGGQGTGLGLSSASGIIKSHRGMITCTSEPGKGTLFLIVLPAGTISSPDSRQSCIGDAQLYSGSETILLVDDEQPILDVGKALLEELGYSVLVANSGDEAIECIRRHRNIIDLVLLDIIMPIKNGITTLHLIKEIVPSCAVILTSGYDRPPQMGQILQDKTIRYIQKPFDIKVLSQEMRSLLQSAKTPRRQHQHI